MQRPIQTLSDVIESVHNQYLYKDNGRCTPHFFVILFDGILGHKAFAVCNGAMFALMLHLFCLNFAGRKENYFIVASIVMASIVILLPGFSHAMLWMSGACNYLWSSVFILFFHYLLSKNIRKRWWGLLFVYGIIAGNTHEGIMIGLSVGYAVYYLSHFKELSAQRWMMLMGLAIGVAFLVFSPGAWARALNANTADTIFRHNDKYIFIVKSLFHTLKGKLWLLYIAIIAMIVTRKVPVLWGITLMTLLTFSLCIYSGVTQFYGLEIVSLIIILSVADYSRLKEKWVYLMNGITILLLGVATMACADRYHLYETLDKILHNTKAKDITLFYNYTSVPYISDRFCLPTMLWTCSIDGQVKLSMSMTKFYHKRSIYCLPLAMKCDIEKGRVTDEFLRDTSYPYYIRKWSGGDSIEGYIELNKSKYADVPVLNLLKRYTISL